MMVFDKITGTILDVAFVSNHGEVFHIINSNGIIYKRFADEIEIVGE